MDAISRFLLHIYGPLRTARLEVRIHAEQRAAYDEAARIEGDADASAWARRILDTHARRTIKGAR